MKNDPVGLEHVESIRGFGERSIDVGQNERCVEAETVWISPYDIGRAFVHVPRFAPRFRVIAQVDARC